MTCPECKGKGKILLFTSEVPCRLCSEEYKSYEIYKNDGTRESVDGFIVGCGVLGIREISMDMWRIDHLPTGCRVADCSTKERAKSEAIKLDSKFGNHLSDLTLTTMKAWAPVESNPLCPMWYKDFANDVGDIRDAFDEYDEEG
jgi:hypothetical protein